MTPRPCSTCGEYPCQCWCLECGDTFRYDDCGGYNPPCECGFHCRHCHDAVEGRHDPDDDYDDEVDDARAEYEERVIREVYGNNGYVEE